MAVIDLMRELWRELLLRDLLGSWGHLHRHVRGLLRHLGMLHNLRVCGACIAHLRMHDWGVSRGIHCDGEGSSSCG